jgi:hypothetical protein
MKTVLWLAAFAVVMQPSRRAPANEAPPHAGYESALYNTATKARDAEACADANLCGGVTPALPLGCEYAWTQDHYIDTVDAINHRIQCSAFYLF